MNVRFAFTEPLVTIANGKEAEEDDEEEGEAAGSL